jgi:xylan 1,4-beta-xylosidase
MTGRWLVPAFLAVSIFLCEAGVCQPSAPPVHPAATQFREIHVDASKVKGTIRSFQGVNGVPTPIMQGLPNLVQQYKALGIDVIRTHDTMGPTDISARFSLNNPLLTWLVPDSVQRAKLVQSGNDAAIFPNWQADPERQENYNFGPSDTVIQGIQATGAQVFYRIGRSWGADYTSLPDLDKFAAVVKHVAMHYDQGWANGFHDAVHYWEFWNEEDIPYFWTDTPETFYKLYEKTARALKSVDPSMKVGADAKAFAYGSGPYREDLLRYCADHKVPLDFYSWHHYTMASADPYDFSRIAVELRKILDDNGFPRAQSILSEWNLTPDFTDREKRRLQGIENAAFIGDVLIYLQDSPVDMAHFYRADAAWMGLFDLQGGYFKPAYAFFAAGKLLSTPQRLELSGSDPFGFAALAGRSNDGKTVQILISNYEIPANYHPRDMQPPEGALPRNTHVTDFPQVKSLPARTNIHYKNNYGFHITVDSLPWGKSAFTVRRYRLTSQEEFVMQKSIGTGSRFEFADALPPPGLELIVLTRE